VLEIAQSEHRGKTAANPKWEGDEGEEFRFGHHCREVDQELPFVVADDCDWSVSQSRSRRSTISVN